MKIDFSKIDVSERPVLVLKTLNEKTICSLGNAFNLTGKFCYNEISEITFDLPAFVNGEPTPNYDFVNGMMLIDMVGYGIFVLRNPKTVSSGLKEIKSCQAYSREYELTRRKIFLDEETYNFWNPVAQDGTLLGIILEMMPDWSVGEIDSSLVGKYRTFKESGSNLYNFMKSTAQKTYNCIFEFDTYNKTISARDVSSTVPVSPVFLSEENLIKEISVEEDTENIFTCLDVNGADGVDIRGVNPLGTNKIYNLDYFMKAPHFDAGMIAKWNEWKETFDANQRSYYDLSVEESLRQSEYLTQNAHLTDLQSELSSYENLRAVYVQAIAQGIDQNANLATVNTNITEKEAEIAEQKSAMQTTSNAIASTLEQMQAIIASTSFESVFTESEIALLRPYFKEDSIEENSFVFSDTQSYNTAGVSESIPESAISFSGGVVTKIANTVDKSIYAIVGGSISVTYEEHEFAANVIRGSLERKSTGAIVMSAYIGSGSGYDAAKDEDFTFVSGCVSMIGTATVAATDDTVPDSDVPNAYARGTSLSISMTGSAFYFTENTTVYQQRSIEWDLYDYGKECLLKLCYPSYTFNISSANFLSLDEFLSFATNLKLGKKVYLDKRGTVLKPILTGVKVDFEDPTSLDLEFGDKYVSSDNTFNLVDLLDQSVSMGKTADHSKYTYSAFVDSGASTQVKDFMNSALDVAKNAIMSSSEQGVSWDSSGLHLRKVNQAGTGFDPEQIWAINNNIVFTDDNWATAKMAVGKFTDAQTGTSWGIVAPNIVGTLLAGENLVIESAAKSVDGAGTQKSVFKVDSSGASLHNASFDVFSGSNLQISLNPDIGIAIGSYPLYSANNEVDEDNAKFWADTNGNLHIKGTLEACDGVFSGALSAATGTFSGELSAATGTFSGAISGGSININDGTFAVTPSGQMTATSGSFGGNLNSAGGTFAGNLSAAGGTFTGNLSAAGGTFSGNLSAAGGTFSGDLSAAGGTFTGDVRGGSFYADGAGGAYSQMTADGFQIFTDSGLNKLGFGWNKTYDSNVSYPYITIGAGNSNNATGAGMIKKYTNGIWIGDDADFGNSSVSYGTGIFINFSSGAVTKYVDGASSAIGGGEAVFG